MKQLNKTFRNFILIASMLAVNSCIHVEIKGAGVFKDVRSRNDEYYSVDVPAGVYGDGMKLFNDRSFTNGFEARDGSKISFNHLGRCGAQLSFTGIMIPIIPFFLPNFCRSDGFHIGVKWYFDLLGITLQLRYNGVTHNPYIDNGSVKFKIENFSTFKSAPDKTLIIHKRKPDGTMWSKELPFDWKIVTEISGGL